MRNVDLTSLLPSLLPRLWYFALRITGDAIEAELLVEHACKHGLELAHLIPLGMPPLLWMFGLTASLGAPVGRKRAQMVCEGARKGALPALSSITRETERDSTDVLTLQAVKRLPYLQLTVVLLAEVERLSWEDTARALGIPCALVPSLLKRANEKVEEFLKSNGRIKYETAIPDVSASQENSPD